MNGDHGDHGDPTGDCTTTGSFDDHGIASGTTLIQRAYYRLSDASIGFAPATDPDIYVPSAAFDPSDGFPRSIRDRIGAHADGWLPIAVSPDTYERGLASVREFLADAGRDPDAITPALYLDVVVGEESDAIEQARDFYDRYYPDWDRLTDEEIRAKGAFGPPAEVAEALDAYEDAGLEHAVVRFATTEQRTQLRRFAGIADID